MYASHNTYVCENCERYAVKIKMPSKHSHGTHIMTNGHQSSPIDWGSSTKHWAVVKITLVTSQTRTSQDRVKTES